MEARGWGEGGSLAASCDLVGRLKTKATTLKPATNYLGNNTNK